MAEDFEDEGPRRKRKGKGISRKKLAVIILVLLLFATGALFQHFLIEPLYGETTEQKYTRCLTQKQVLDQRFVECDNQARACDFQLQQCLGNS